jgi:hypothetical protein
MNDIPIEILNGIAMRDDKALIALYCLIAQQVSLAEQNLKKKLATRTNMMEAVKAQLMSRLIQRNAKNTKTSAGVATLVDFLRPKVTDRDALLSWAQEHWTNGGGEMVVIKPPVEAIRDYQSMNGGQNPPGVETTIDTHLRITPGA